MPMTPPKGGYMAPVPALDLTTSLRGDLEVAERTMVGRPLRVQELVQQLWGHGRGTGSPCNPALQCCVWAVWRYGTEG